MLEKALLQSSSAESEYFMNKVLHLSQVNMNYLIELYNRFGCDGDIIAKSLYLTYGRFISFELFQYLRINFGCKFKDLKVNY